ncbi:hypothetical protein B0F90DRAFT_687304 [Multifurca ochricompacta]|uniref:Uncharacterized protein n=1 Tax=Multifurca ochricompacta TaxID=376703 RepID=A0AAD4M3W9_9AGAM|nr:hypothetical protein B0F90DRAFT_687304 [Multifurca ochricompacta]
MRVQADGFREPVAPPFVPPLSYPNELRPEDRFAAHPSLPLRPSSPSLNPGLSGRNRFSERGFAGLPQIRYTDPQAGRASPLIPNTNQQGYPLARSKRKRRGGVNRKKRGVFHPQGGLSRDALVTRMQRHSLRAAQEGLLYLLFLFLRKSSKHLRTRSFQQH